MAEVFEGLLSAVVVARHDELNLARHPVVEFPLVRLVALRPRRQNLESWPRQKEPFRFDGVGGGSTLTSKVAIVSRSAEPGCDVNYLTLPPEELFFRALRNHEFDV